jgi:cobalt-zinc-cadmium efflux system membrane fusion protein
MKIVLKNKRIILGRAVLMLGVMGTVVGAGVGEEGVKRVVVTQKQVQEMNIKVTKAEKGNVPNILRAPGEVHLDANRVAYISPQIPGVVRQINAELGQNVAAGEVLGIINSRDLATAKSDYLTAVEMVQLRQENVEQEERRVNENTSTEHDLFKAEQALKEARITEQNPLKNLQLFGLQPEELAKLHQEKVEDYSSYQMLSPIQGTVIQKNLFQGKAIREEEPLFVIADLSQVWVDLAISQDAISSVRVGHPVKVRLPDGLETEVNIDFISPIVDQETRSATARITLDNPDGQFRPGTFVEAMIQIPSTQEVVVVPKGTVQLVFDYPTVFVWNNGAFEQREVATGISDGTNVEILRGVSEGELVASENAFHLKAQVIKAAAGDAVSGHGHAH